MKRTTYVVIPKMERIELLQWGIDVECDRVLRVISDSGVDRSYTLDEFLQLHTAFDTGSLVIFSPRAAVPRETMCREQLVRLLPKEAVRLRFFVHFGDLTISSSFPNEAAILNEFQKMLPSADAARCECFPFTGRIHQQYPWSNKIWSIQKNISQRTVVSEDIFKGLDEAWSLAADYFRVERSICAVLSALFPLFLTVTGSESSADQEAALRTAQLLVKNDAFHWAISSVISYAQRDLTFQTHRFDLSSPDFQLDGFVEWFRCLSKSYTALTRMGANVHGQSAPPNEDRPK